MMLYHISWGQWKIKSLKLMTSVYPRWKSKCNNRPK